MTLSEFRKLKHRDFSNGAVTDEIEKVIEQRDALLAACVAAESILDSLVIDEPTRKAGLWQGAGPRRVLSTLNAAISKARGQ